MHPINGNERNAVETLYATGCWLLERSRVADAAKVFRALTLVAPAEDRSWVALGACHEQLEQVEVALELYGLGALAAAPAPRCWTAKARLLRKIGMADEARFALSQASDTADASSDNEIQDILKSEMRNVY